MIVWEKGDDTRFAQWCSSSENQVRINNPSHFLTWQFFIYAFHTFQFTRDASIQVCDESSAILIGQSQSIMWVLEKKWLHRGKQSSKRPTHTVLDGGFNCSWVAQWAQYTRAPNTHSAASFYWMLFYSYVYGTQYIYINANIDKLLCTMSGIILQNSTVYVHTQLFAS